MLKDVLVVISTSQRHVGAAAASSMAARVQQLWRIEVLMNVAADDPENSSR